MVSLEADHNTGNKKLTPNYSTSSVVNIQGLGLFSRCMGTSAALLPLRAVWILDQSKMGNLQAPQEAISCL
jgi:hypothetical protein